MLNLKSELIGGFQRAPTIEYGLDYAVYTLKEEATNLQESMTSLDIDL